MNNQIVKDLIINNFTIGRPGSPGIQNGVFHTTADSPQSSIQGIASWWNNPQAKSSAHGIIGLDGTRIQTVDYFNTAWHAANWWVNITSIGLEHQDHGNSNDSVRTPEQYQTSAQWVVEIYQQFKVPIKLVSCYPKYLPDGKTPHPQAMRPMEPGWVRHRQVSLLGTNCPDGLDCEKIIAMALSLLNKGTI